LRELIPLVCAGDHLREANDRSYSSHPSCGRGYHTEVDNQGRHERGCTRALALLRHEAEEQIEQLQYHHFPSRAREGVEAVVMPAGDRDHIRCFTDQVKLTRTLVRDLDEAIKEVNLLG
jgi:hypothetical protein